MASRSRQIPATFKALLVDGVNRDAVAGIDWVLRPSTPYYQSDGLTEIGTTTAGAVFDLVFGTLLHSWDSSAALANKFFWSGLASTGWALGNACNGWTSSATSASGQIGVIGRVNGSAIGVGASSLCQNRQRLVCVEQ